MEVVFEQEDVPDDHTGASVGGEGDEGYQTDGDPIRDDTDNTGNLGHSNDILDVISDMQDTQDQSSSATRNPATTITTLLSMGTLQLEANECDKADALFNAALHAFRSSSDASLKISFVEETVLKSLGHVRFKRQQYQEAMRYFIEAQRVTNESSSASSATRTDSQQSLVSTQPADQNFTQNESEQSEILAEARIFRGVGIAHYGKGEYQQSLEAYLAALLGYQGVVGRYHYEVAESLVSIGVIYECLQTPHAALAVYQQAIDVLQRGSMLRNCEITCVLSVDVIAQRIEMLNRASNI